MMALSTAVSDDDTGAFLDAVERFAERRAELL
jgi:hypothetical protein